VPVDRSFRARGLEDPELHESRALEIGSGAIFTRDLDDLKY